MSNNLVVLTGHLGQDITVRYTGGGKAVGNASIAVQVGWGDNKKTEWFNFVAWGDTATAMQASLKKGSKTTLVGRLSSRKYKNKEGNDVTAVEVIVDSFSGGNPLPEKEAEKPIDDSDVPF